MGVDACIAGRPRQVFILTIWNVKVCLGVTVFLGQTKVDNVDLVSPLSNAHQEIIRLDIAVNEGLGMNILDARDELIGQQENGLQGELAVAEIEEILQARSEQIQDHGIVVTFGSKPTHKRNANASGQRFVDASLVLQLRVLGLDTLQLDCYLLARDDVRSYVIRLVKMYNGLPRLALPK